MREIKFRGKSQINGEWIYGIPIDICGEKAALVYDEFEITIDGLENTCYELVKPESVGQFTGLYDKNGVEIYEGDVLDFLCAKKEIKFKYGAFGYDNDFGGFIPLGGNLNYKFQPFEKDERITIIGNIHDSPELLRKEDEQ